MQHVLLQQQQPLKLRYAILYGCVMILFLLVTQSLHAERFEGRISLTRKVVSIEQIFKDINQQTGLSFVYDKQMIKKGTQVNINVKDASLTQVLDICFKDQPFTYKLVDNTVIVTPPAEEKEKKKEEVFYAAPPPPDIIGKILDESDNPLTGASVNVKGTNLGATADEKGNFVLRNVASDATLVFSFVGFQDMEKTATAGKPMTVKLSMATGQLSDVVVSTGYSTFTKKTFTGSATRVDGDVLENRPTPSFDQALAGQAAGVNITSNGGAVNAAPVFRIRGFNSINLSSYPLIVIDGITAFTGDMGNAAQNNPLADINPNDIESVDILKDASAAAIYGSRAANGVVVITTKKGKKGRMKVSYDGWVGANAKPPRLPDLLNAEEYVMIKNEALVNAGAQPAYNLQTLDGQVVDTKWFDYVYHTGVSHSNSLNVSGGTESTTYFASVGYTDQNGFMVRNGFERINARANLDQKIGKKLSIGTNINFSNSINTNLTSGTNAAFSLNNLAREAMVLPPNLAPFNEDGSYNTVGNSIGYGANTILTGYYNPLPLIEHDNYSSENNSFQGAAYAEYQIIKGLKLKTNYTLNILNIENRSFSNPYQAGGFANNGSATNSFSKNKRTDWTNTLNYSTTIGKDHGLSILLGYEEIHTTGNNWGVTRQNLSDRYFETFEGGFTQLTGSSGRLSENGFRSYFSSVNYDFKRKYMLSASFRRDGFSGLSESHKFGNFGGGSIGWNVSEENFYQNSGLADVISSLKLRGSYGEVGNINGVGDFVALSLYSSGNYAGVPTLVPSQTGNNELTWENSRKSDVGINLGFLNGRIMLDIDWYKNNIDGMILDAQQAPSKGIPGNSITSNIGSMYNTGFEFDVRAKVISGKDFNWNLNANFSTLKNRVTSLANDDADIWSSGLETSNITRVGQPVGAIYVVKTVGVNPENGLRMYENRNGEIVQYNPVSATKWTYVKSGSAAPAIDAYGDGRVFGTAIPSYFGGVNSTMNYRGFDLFLGFTYAGGYKMYNGTKATLLDNRFFNNQKEILDRWTKPGDITDIPKLHYNDQTASGSVLMHSGNVEDGTFIKLRNVSLGYSLPANIIQAIHISTARVYVMATNFILYTNYTGMDPEISANGDSNTAPGRDKNAVPAGRNYTVGLSLSF